MENSYSRKAEVYIIHIDEKIGGHAQHYVGYTTLGIEERMRRHRSGLGSKLLAHASKLGINYRVALLVPLDNKIQARNLELKFKAEKNLKHHCRFCRKEAH